MQQDVFDKIRQIVYDHSGISIKDGKKSMVAARIAKRLCELQLEDDRAYLNYLLTTNPDKELVELLDVISTNVTHFFREPNHFKFISEHFSNWLDQGKTQFRFWSAACSTGQEPYSLALTLQSIPDRRHKQADVKILATDISTKVLEQSKRGEYTKEQLAPIDDDMVRRYFEKHTSASRSIYKVAPVIRRLVSFARINLSAPPFPMKGPMDIVMCRNVMICFDAQTRQRLLTEIHRLLKPGGFVIVGHAS